MPKPCPVNPNHPTKKVTMSNSAFDFCEVCREDVDYLARQQNPLEEEAVSADDQEEDLDELEMADEVPAFNPWQNPAGFNPNPSRNMGQGTQQLVLVNDPLSAAHVVQDILQRVFNKSAQEANYIMQDAHFKGESICFYGDDAELNRLLQEVEQIKQEWMQQRQCPPQHIQNLTFRRETRTP